MAPHNASAGATETLPYLLIILWSSRTAMARAAVCNMLQICSMFMAHLSNHEVKHNWLGRADAQELAEQREKLQDERASAEHELTVDQEELRQLRIQINQQEADGKIATKTLFAQEEVLKAKMLEVKAKEEGLVFWDEALKVLELKAKENAQQVGCAPMPCRTLHARQAIQNGMIRRLCPGNADACGTCRVARQSNGFSLDLHSRLACVSMQGRTNDCHPGLWKLKTRLAGPVAGIAGFILHSLQGLSKAVLPVQLPGKARCRHEKNCINIVA